VKNIVQESNNNLVKTKRLHKITAAYFKRHKTLRTRFVLDGITQAFVVYKVITNYTTGTPILHVEASFISVERRLRREILSRTSLKYYIHFSFILKLIIFIYKQLKRHVAFSIVHFDIKPQIVTLQNNFLF